MPAKKPIGSKRMVVGAHYGLGDWMAQRATAVIMVIYTLVLLVAFLGAHEFSYDGWGRLFSRDWMKVATFIAFAALFYHTWVGMRDIWMDYVKPVAVRLSLQVLTIAWLIGCAGYLLQILWRA